MFHVTETDVIAENDGKMKRVLVDVIKNKNLIKML